MLRETRTAPVVAALAKLAALWQTRLDTFWTPPAASAFPETFPWAQVRLSLSALLPGMRGAGAWVERALSKGRTPPGTVTVVLAGNTPLLAWSPLCACLLSGAETVRVKLSRDEGVWTRLFVESLAEVAPEVAARVELYDFPGADDRTYALLTDADAVIAYGSDAAIAALRERTPPCIPFFGYGHAVSVGFVTEDGQRHRTYAARGFARDILMYNQAGCLSPHILYDTTDNQILSDRFGAEELSRALLEAASDLNVLPVSNAKSAVVIQKARDMALFSGQDTVGDDALRWTVITAGAIPYPPPVGQGVVHVSPVGSLEQLRELLQPVWRIVTCAGIAGEFSREWKTVLHDAGVSRICQPGEMQTPPLDWANGNRDLLAELLTLREKRNAA